MVRYLHILGVTFKCAWSCGELDPFPHHPFRRILSTVVVCAQVLSAKHCIDISGELNGKLTKIVFAPNMLDPDAPSREVERVVTTSDYGMDLQESMIWVGDLDLNWVGLGLVSCALFCLLNK